MRPGPSVVCTKILCTTTLDASPRPIVEIITEIILADGWCRNRSEAREKAETWQEVTLTRLQQEVSALQELGRFARIAFNSSSLYMIQGTCFIESRDSDELKDKKTRRSRFTAYYEAISSLTPHQFERLCEKLIQLIGVENPVVTRTSSDEGIDFYGRLTFMVG